MLKEQVLAFKCLCLLTTEGQIEHEPRTTVESELERKRIRDFIAKCDTDEVRHMYPPRTEVRARNRLPTISYLKQQLHHRLAN